MGFKENVQEYHVRTYIVGTIAFFIFSLLDS